MFCVQELADQGAGHPDFGLYAAKQVQRGMPREGLVQCLFSLSTTKFRSRRGKNL